MAAPVAVGAAAAPFALTPGVENPDVVDWNNDAGKLMWANARKSVHAKKDEKFDGTNGDLATFPYPVKDRAEH